VSEPPRIKRKTTTFWEALIARPTLYVKRSRYHFHFSTCEPEYKGLEQKNGEISAISSYFTPSVIIELCELNRNGEVKMKESAICFVFGAGERTEPAALPQCGDFVIAADGGYEYALECGVRVDILVGDFDSLRCRQDSLPEELETIALPQEKDDTDMRAALKIGMQRGFRRFRIYGGLGGRLDHSIANLQCLADIAAQGAEAHLCGAEVAVTALAGGSISFAAGAAGTVSVFSHTDESRGVCETGLKYRLSDATLTNAFPMGISNEFTGEPATVSVRDGVIIVMYPCGAAPFLRETDVARP
jgi:thiamine pyrophosphokinase